MLDLLNFRLGEIIGLIHALEKGYLYQNKTQLRYNFGPVYNGSHFTYKFQGICTDSNSYFDIGHIHLLVCYW